jgi:hypothetical protein
MESSSNILIERTARRITDWKLTAPAVAFLQVNKPLSFVGSQVLLMLQPMLDVFVTRQLTTEWATLMADRDQIEVLIARLEAMQHSGSEVGNG